MELEFNLSPAQLQSQKQNMSASMQYENWRVRPLEQVPPTEAVRYVAVGGDLGALNQVWKRIRRRIFAQGEEGGNVNIGIQGNASSAKSEIGQAILYMATHDFFLHTEAAKRGLSIVPRTMPFALAAKAFQLPKERGGPGLIRASADHGKFEDGEYSTISIAMQTAFNIYTAEAKRGIVNLNILEGSGLPYPVKVGYPVGLYGMSDRGVSPIDNLAFHPSQATNSFIFLMTPNKQVQEFGLSERRFDPNSTDVGGFFRGRMRYVVSTKAGVMLDIADLGLTIQSDVLRLLLMSMAPYHAAERSKAQYEQMKVSLVDEFKVLKDTRDESYLELLQARLTTKVAGQVNIPSDHVIIAETNFQEGFKRDSSNVRNLDYLLRHCVWSQSYPDMIPASLRRFL